MKQTTILLAAFLFFSLNISAQCTGLNANISFTDLTCFGSNDGQIIASPTGGSGNYNYELLDQGNSSLGTNTSGAFSGLFAGNYSFVIEDIGNACFDTTTVTLNEPTPILVNETITANTSNNNGAITISVTGGSGGYSYNWTGPNGFTSTNQNISGLAGGTYTLVVTDNNGCFETLTYTVNSIFSTTYYTIDPLCTGSADGGIQISVNGGSGSYIFEVLDFSFNSIYSSSSSLNYIGLPAGAYYYAVNDQVTLDSDTVYFELYDPFPITVVESITNTSCTQCDGSIILSITGGAAPYDCSWSNGSTTLNQYGLCDGVYNVSIYDANGCWVYYTYTVGNSGGSNIFASTSSMDATCGACDGSITVSATGGSAPYTYQWNDPTFQTLSTASGLCVGAYNVTVTDANGCSTTVSDVVSDGATVSGTTANITDASCAACDGSVQIIGAGGTPPYSYFNPVTSETNTTGVFDSLCAAPHYIEVIDANGCSGMVTFMIDQVGLSGLNYNSSITSESAPGANDGAIDISYDLTAYPNLTFLWLPDSATTADLYNLTGGTYSVTIMDSVSGGCVSYTEVVNTLPSNGYISGQIFQDNNSDCVFNTGDGYLSNVTVTVSDGTNTYTTITSSYGYYTVLVPNGTYTVTVNFPGNFTPTCGNSQTVTVAGNYITGINFGGNAPPFEDLCTYASGWGFAPGFTAYIYAYVHNNGNMTSSGELSIVIPSGTTYMGASITPSSINGDTLYFTLNAIPSGSYTTVYVYVGVPTWYQIGDPFDICSSVDLLGGGTDTNPACNDDCYYSVVVGSYDPNDKAVQPQGIDNQGFIETDVDEFTYTIRFQNTGTAPAHNVYITDTLDPMLDRSTLQVLAASHDMNIEFINNDVVKFRFNNIMLPDSNANEPESHGYVQFRISTMNTPQLTETVQNTANIYFDFNEPVITNTTLNTYADFSTVEASVADNLLMYPNPATTLLYTSAEEMTAYKILDINGKLVQNGTISPHESIDVQQLTPGLYFIELDTTGGILRNKFTKQ